MNQERKDHLRKVMLKKWKDAKKYAEILGKPKEQVFIHLDKIKKYSKQLNHEIPYYIDLVIKECWPEEWNQESQDKKLKDHKEQVTKEINEHNEAVKKSQKEKAEMLDYKYSEPERKVISELEDLEKQGKIKLYKIEERTLQEQVHIMIWAIRKIGSTEKAEKLFQAAKLMLNTLGE